MTKIRMGRSGSIVVAMALLLAIPSTVQATETFKWRMASSFPLKLPVLTTGAKRFANYVSEASGGRLIIEIDDSSVHKKGRRVLGLVQDGGYQTAFTVALFYKKDHPEFDIFTGVPYGFTPLEHYAWMYEAGGEQLLKSAFDTLGVVAISVGNTGTQLGGWFKSPMDKPTDFEALRMRVAGLGGEVIKSLGAETVGLPGGKIPEGFKEDKINAAEFVGPAVDDKLKLYDYARYYYTPWNQPSVDQILLVNKAAYDSLPDDLKAIVKVAARASVFDSLSNALAENAAAWDRIRASKDVEVRSFSDEIAKQMQVNQDEILKQLAAGNPNLAKVLDSYTAFMTSMKEYSELTDRPFLKMRASN